MPKLTIMPESRTIEFDAGQSLMQIMQDNNVPVDSACGGRGTCGKCKVNIIDANGADALETGVQLACKVFPKSDITIEPVRNNASNNASNNDTATGYKALTSGYLPEFEFDSSAVPASAPYGIAIDIGTTTVVCTLVDMRTGEMLGQASEINAQKDFGADVISRITYEIENPETGIEKLQEAIVCVINRMIAEVCQNNRISSSQVNEVSVSANCTMTHMLLGVDARSIGVAPFTPAFTEAMYVTAESIGISAAPGAMIYCLPQVSGYIGGDIVAGAHVCDLKDEPGNVMFIDIGTNGEIVLSSHGKLISCSCAAGPALEGMNISCGMRAEEGAIEDVEITEEGVNIKVIGDIEPVGICGSGILAAVKELVRTGIVKDSGAFVRTRRLNTDDYRLKYIRVDEEGKRSFVISSKNAPISISMLDVRQVQLAKGAILSGFTALLNKSGLKYEDLDKVIVAGQFGAHLPASSLTGSGLLPFEVEDKIEYVGNTSMTGAYMALMSRKERSAMEELAKQIEYLELGAIENYENLLADCMMFPSFT